MQQGDRWQRTEIVHGGHPGLGLRCYGGTGKPFVRRTFTDGAELLGDAAIERFELEALGWQEKSARGRT